MHTERPGPIRTLTHSHARARSKETMKLLRQPDVRMRDGRDIWSLLRYP